MMENVLLYFWSLGLNTKIFILPALGASSDKLSSQNISLRCLQHSRNWELDCQAAKGDIGQEFCQLLRLLWEVGAGGASQ